LGGREVEHRSIMTEAEKEKGVSKREKRNETSVYLFSRKEARKQL